MLNIYFILKATTAKPKTSNCSLILYAHLKKINLTLFIATSTTTTQKPGELERK